MDGGHSRIRSSRKHEISSASDRLARRRSNALAAVTLATLAFAAPATAATETETFNYTGAAQSWTVPPAVTEATFDLYGAQGGGAASGTFAAGRGGRATATIAVIPGSSIQINVGGIGTLGTGGFNGGGTGDHNFGNGGGGASDIRIGGTTLFERVLVAGGGGGSLTINNGGSPTGGHGGGESGEAGGSANFADSGPGGGGTQLAGGTAGTNATPGTFGVGGSNPTSVAGAGGGGGWYGGGGGRGAGGGGGSGHGPGGTVYETGVRSGNGLATVSYELDPAPVTQISSGPEGLTDDASPSFAFASDQASSTFECSLDGAPFRPCASPQGYSNLADAQHSFAVRATNAQLTTEPDPATRQFTVDTSVSGSVSAKKNQSQSNKIVVKVKVGATDEPLTAKAKGKINVERKGFKLAPQKIELAAGQTQTLKLKPKKDEERILKALAEGTAVKAKLQVKFTDPLGNTALDKPQVTLTG